MSEIKISLKFYTSKLFHTFVFTLLAPLNVVASFSCFVFINEIVHYFFCVVELVKVVGEHSGLFEVLHVRVS